MPHATLTRPLTLGVIGASRKPDELRVPLHPSHMDRIPTALRARISLEEGYGRRFGVSDDDLRPFVGRIAARAEVIASSDVILLPKPQAEDVREMRDGQVLWGWPHLVQDEEFTQLAIDKKLTVIAFEAMQHWGPDGSLGLHVFHMNNELAGYCSVLHALQLCGATADYGRRLTAVVIGFGATARGAVTALRAHGVQEVKVLTNRRTASVASPIHAAQMIQFDHDEAPYSSEVLTDEGRVALAPFLADSDIVVNCTLQNPNRPLMYLRESDLAAFRPGSLIVDVSCDEAMAFEWARMTGFTDPMFTVGGVNYYAVDHSPSYLWNSASWEISEALLRFLPIVMGGAEAWPQSETITRAIEVRDGVVLNPAIIEYQHREPTPPHAVDDAA